MRLAREHDNADARKMGLRDRKRQLERDLAGTGANDMRARPARAELARINRELALVNNNLKGIKAIEDRLYSPEEGEPRAYLLKFEPGTTADVDGNGKPDDDGRVVIAVGNPDTADHVATYVPGTGTEIAGAEGAIDRADRMAYDANDETPERTAVILWLDYDAPDEVSPNAMSADYAEDAGDDLRRFQKGLRVTHEGAGSHNTVIGHSYGTTVIGHAAEDGPIHANDLIFVASPGVGVDNATDLGVDPDHVWATRADGDPIGNAGGWHGGVDPGRGQLRGPRVQERPRRASDYWTGEEDDKKHNEARDNMARTITGRHGAVTSPPEPTPPKPPHNYVDGKWN